MRVYEVNGVGWMWVCYRVANLLPASARTGGRRFTRRFFQIHWVAGGRVNTLFPSVSQA